MDLSRMRGLRKRRMKDFQYVQFATCLQIKSIFAQDAQNSVIECSFLICLIQDLFARSANQRNVNEDFLFVKFEFF